MPQLVLYALILFTCLFSFVCSHKAVEAQLYEDLLYDYNKIPRPVKNSSEILMVDVGASLIRIIDVDEKNQILTLMLWLEMKWIDSKLRWDPKKYGEIKVLHIPSDLIWTPVIVSLLFLKFNGLGSGTLQQRGGRSRHYYFHRRASVL